MCDGAEYYSADGRGSECDSHSCEGARSHRGSRQGGSPKPQAEFGQGGVELGGAHSAHYSGLLGSALHDQVHYLPGCGPALPCCAQPQGRVCSFDMQSHHIMFPQHLAWLEEANLTDAGPLMSQLVCSRQQSCISSNTCINQTHASNSHL